MDLDTKESTEQLLQDNIKHLEQRIKQLENALEIIKDDKSLSFVVQGIAQKTLEEK